MGVYLTAVGPHHPRDGFQQVGRELQGAVDTLLHYARIAGSPLPELPRLLARVSQVPVLPTLLERGPETPPAVPRMMLSWMLYEACIALSEPLNTECAKADGDEPDRDHLAQATAILLALQCRDGAVSSELAATFDSSEDPAPTSRHVTRRRLCVLFCLLFGWPAFSAYVGSSPGNFWQHHVARAIPVLLLLEPTIDHVMQIIPAAPPEWIQFEAPAPPCSTEQATACVHALRDSILLLGGYSRSRPAAELALHHLVRFGQYAATGGQGPHASELCRHVSMALTAVVQERSDLGRRSHNLIAFLVARVHRGYRAHPAVQACFGCPARLLPAHAVVCTLTEKRASAALLGCRTT